MKIKILVPFVESSWGGSHNSSSDLFSELKKTYHKKIDVNIILPKSSPAKKIFENNKLKVIEFYPVIFNSNISTIVSRILKIFIGSIYAIYFIIKLSPKIIDVQDSQTLFSWGIPARLLGIKVVWHSRQFSNNSFLIFLRGIIANRIICLGKNDPNLKYFPNKCEIISNIYDINYLRSLKPFLKKEIFKKDQMDDKLIVCVGNFSKRKRQDFAIEVINHLHEKNIKVSLFFIGNDKNMYGEQIKKIPLIIPNKVKYLGVKTREFTLRFIKSANVLIQTSISEAGPRVVYESLLLNTKVVTTNVGDVGSIKSRNLSIIDFDNKDLFIKEVEKALFLSKQSKKILFCNQFSSKYVVAKTLLSYEKLFK